MYVPFARVRYKENKSFETNNANLISIITRMMTMTDRWRDAMRRGDFDGAWNISDALLEPTRAQDHTTLPRHFQSIWDGRSVAGKRVLVRCYHGLGDTIQFIRYAALLKQLAAEVIVWVQPSLIPLLQTVKGIDRFTSVARRCARC